MTKAELLKALEPYPDNMDVFIHTPEEEFTYTPLETVTCSRIYFYDPGNEECKAEEDCIVLDVQ